MNILITGAQGAIGKKLVKKLDNSDNKITVLIRSENTDPSLKSVVGDLFKKDTLIRATENTDAVIHLAGITHSNDKSLYYKVNTEGTKNLIAACLENKVKKFIYISTRAASNEAGAYGRSKLLAEVEVKKSEMDWIILRPAEVYGAGEKESITRLIKFVKKFKVIPIIGDGRYYLAPVYVDDVVNAIVDSLKIKISKKMYTLAGPLEMTYNEVVDEIVKYLGLERFKLHIPFIIFKLVSIVVSAFGSNSLVSDQIPRLMSKKSADISTASKDLNFHPIKFEEGLKFL